MFRHLWRMTVQGVRGMVEAAIQRAAQATGVDFGFMLKTARRESGMNPSAHAAASSAAGLFQFIDQTWLSTLKQHGAKHGYAAFAEMINRGADGRYRVGDAGDRRAVMALKLDPHAASLMAGELASDHAAYLRGRTGREPTGGELYAAHFLGPSGSARLIEAMRTQPGASAASLFPEAAQANRSIFYLGGRAATVAEVYANLTRTGGAEPAIDARPEAGFVQYAARGREAAQAQQEQLVAMILGGSGAGGVGLGGDRGGLAGSLFTSEMLRALSEARDKG